MATLDSITVTLKVSWWVKPLIGAIGIWKKLRLPVSEERVLKLVSHGILTGVLPSKPVSAPMPPVRPTLGPRPMFDHRKTYPIATLPDDLYDEKPATEKWAIRDALFWNECQGWWMAHINDVRREVTFGQCVARFWRPLPPHPMTREEILAEQGMVVCPSCDRAIAQNKAHACAANPARA